MEKRGGINYGKIPSLYSPVKLRRIKSKGREENEIEINVAILMERNCDLHKLMDYTKQHETKCKLVQRSAGIIHRGEY
jgi:aconitase A